MDVLSEPQETDEKSVPALVQIGLQCVLCYLSWGGLRNVAKGLSVDCSRSAVRRIELQ